MIITKTMLKRVGVCKDQYALFIELFPDGAEWNDKENLEKAYDAGLDLCWFVYRCSEVGIVSKEHESEFTEKRDRIHMEWDSPNLKELNRFRESDGQLRGSIASLVCSINRFTPSGDVVATGKLIAKMGEDLQAAEEKTKEARKKVLNEKKRKLIDLYFSIPLRSPSRQKKS